MTQKFIDRDGLKVLWKQTSLQDYPNNETLMAVIDAIDETKSDKNHTHPTGDIEGLEETINDISKAIIDVVELPTENIREDCFYRLVSAKFVYNEEIYPNWIIQCVDEFPESPEPVSKDNVNIYAYYNTEDNDVYGYVDDFVSQAGGGIPTGWYTLQQLAPAFNLQWIGVITHIDDAKEDDSWKALLSYSFHIYKDGWKELPYAYESAPEFDIKWDGDMTDHMVLDMSALGYENLYYTKVSDIVLTVDELSGSTMEIVDITNNEVQSGIVGIGTDLFINSDMFDGAIVVTDFYLNDKFIIVVHDADTLATSLGIPTGIYSNGVYFWLNTEVGHISRLISPIKKILKIDSKFIDVNILDNLAAVATTGNYNDLINKPTIYADVIRYDTNQSFLNDSQKQRARNNIDVYSKNEIYNKSEVKNYMNDHYVSNVDGTKIGVPDPYTNEQGEDSDILQVVDGEPTWVGIDEVLENTLDEYAKTTEVDEKLEIVDTILTGTWSKLHNACDPICYGNGKFVAVDYDIASYSSDGKKWNKVNLPDRGYRSICYGNGKFVAANYGTFSDTSRIIIYSEDGINWNTVNNFVLDSCHHVCYGGGKFFVYDNKSINSPEGNPRIAYSEDLIHWNVAPKIMNNYKMVYGNNIFLCENYYSIDGLTWTSIKRGIQNPIYGNKEFVSLYTKYHSSSPESSDNSNFIQRSTDGINWNTITCSGIDKIDFLKKGECFFYGNNKYIFTGINEDTSDLLNIYYSTNGYDFELSTTYRYNDISSLYGCYGDGKFIIVDANNNFILHSEDGINWSDEIDTTIIKSITQSNQDVTSEVAQLIQPHLSLTAEDVGALPADTVIPSIEGLATESYVAETIQTYINESILGGEW